MRRGSSLGSRGFTLLEIMVASIILAGMGALLFGSFFTARRWIVETSSGVPMNLARERLEELQMSVRSDTWDTGALVATGAWVPEAPITLDGIPYTRSTRVSSVGTMPYRKVEAKVEW
jgi:prepilin-type N-terminal cleavage/methylation domain-containing protein